MEHPSSSPTPSDAELLAAVRAGDLTAYGVLYQRHLPAAHRLARHLLGRGSDADDVVADTFTRILETISHGGGPVEALRPYLLAALRRVAVDLIRRQRRQIPTDAASIPDLPGEPVADPVLARLEQSLVARAFLSLPERWSAVLWHTEVERAKAADVAVLLGLTPNGVAALSYRAREGLRQAYLQLHLSDRARPECQAAASNLGAYVRGRLSDRDSRMVREHLRSCADCREAKAELAAINSALRTVLAPVFLGGLASAAGSAASPGRWTGHLIRFKPAVVATAGACAAVTLLPGATVPRPVSLPPAARTVVRPVAAPAISASTAKHASSHADRALRHGGSRGRFPLPSPIATTALTAQLKVSVSAAGLLDLGTVVVVTVRVSDPGTAATGPLASRLALPPGLSLLGLATRSSGWTCSAGSCAHAAIAARARTAVAFRVLIVSLSGCGQPILATASSGPLSATAASAKRVTCPPL